MLLIDGREYYAQSYRDYVLSQTYKGQKRMLGTDISGVQSENHGKIQVF